MARVKIGPILLVAACALILPACHRKSQPKAPAAPAAEALSFARATPDAIVKLTLAPEIGAHPGLRHELYDDGVKELMSFIQTAQGDHVHLKAKGMPAPAYTRTLEWSLTAATPHLLGARQSWSDFTGGAHPNHGSRGLVWDVTGDHELYREDLFVANADQTRLDGVLCDAIKASKARRPGSTEDAESWPCPKWADSDFVLARSTVPNRIGGLVFLFDPYSIGPYAEGDYAVTIPLSAFQEELAPRWADDFAGAPAKLE